VCVLREGSLSFSHTLPELYNIEMYSSDRCLEIFSPPTCAASTEAKVDKLLQDDGR
jgi:hypothetical protein